MLLFFFKETPIYLLYDLLLSHVTADLTERHPITNAIDGKNSWWQSPSIKNGIEYHYVTITLDLQQVNASFSFFIIFYFEIVS